MLNMTKTLREKFSHICRTCLIESENLESIFNIENISEMLMSCTSVIVTVGDGLPENVCTECFQQIKDTFSFKKLCEESDLFLRKYVNTNDVFHPKQKELYNETTDNEGKSFISEKSNMLKNEINVDHYNDVDIISDSSETEKYNVSLNINDISNNDQVESYTKQEKHYEVENQSGEKLNCFVNNDKIFSNSDTCTKLTFDCKQCEKVFVSRVLLRMHLTKCHGAKKSKIRDKSNDFVKTKKLPRTCDICNKTFRFHSNLERHKLTHTGEKPYLCNICGKGFNQMSYLKIHVFTHTGEKPYKCQTCDKSFAAPGTLMTHMRTHTGERPHICKICGKGFPQSGYLSVHIRTHTGEKPTECSVCHRRFTQSGRLAIHMRMHSGEKPYNCTQCDKSFAIKGTLKKHLRTHTGERLFVCKICGLAFGQSGTLKTHMKVHQKKEY